MSSFFIASLRVVIISPSNTMFFNLLKNTYTQKPRIHPSVDSISTQFPECFDCWGGYFINKTIPYGRPQLIHSGPRPLFGDMEIMRGIHVSDELLGTFMPILVYWAYSGIYVLLGSLENYRLHTKKDEDEKNLASKKDVVKGVLLQQAVQAVVATIIFAVTGRDNESTQAQKASFFVLARQFLVAMMVLDTWQYFIHRYMHHNKFLYRHIHSQHHRLVVTYAFGALYNHPLEGLFLDIVGGALSFLVSGMSPRASIFFFSFANLKAVDDHCGLWLPGNLFHVFFRNNSAYHDIHHQLYGNKYNFSQPFFVMWDRILGTYMPYSLEKRSNGGLQVRPTKDSKEE